MKNTIYVEIKIGSEYDHYDAINVFIQDEDDKLSIKSFFEKKYNLRNLTLTMDIDDNFEILSSAIAILFKNGTRKETSFFEPDEKYIDIRTLGDVEKIGEYIVDKVSNIDKIINKSEKEQIFIVGMYTSKKG